LAKNTETIKLKTIEEFNLTEDSVTEMGGFIPREPSIYIRSEEINKTKVIYGSEPE